MSEAVIWVIMGIIFTEIVIAEYKRRKTKRELKKLEDWANGEFHLND